MTENKTYMDDADRYDKIFELGWLDAIGDKKLINFIKNLDRNIIYEPGCGTGLLTEQLAKLDGIDSIIAVDPNEIYIKKARERLSKYPNVRVICDNSLDYDLSEQADLIVSKLVYHHIPDEQKPSFLKKLGENLKPGGRILIMDIFIPEYSSEKEREESLRKLHNYKKSLLGNIFLEEIEMESLELGLKKKEEYKISLDVFKDNVKKSGLNLDELKLIKDKRIDNPELNGLYLAVIKL